MASFRSPGSTAERWARPYGSFADVYGWSQPGFLPRYRLRAFTARAQVHDARARNDGTSLAISANVRVLVLVLVALARSAHAQHCDPASSTQKVPVPQALQLATTCGNGRLDTYALSCTHQTSGGCGQPPRSSTTCETATELCDGAVIGNRESCKTLGFGSGTLRCKASCDGFDTDPCSMCRPGFACHEESEGPYYRITALAQGQTLRLFWIDGRAFRVADLDAKGALVNKRTVADVKKTDLIPMLVGTSALALLDDDQHPALSIVPAKGEPRRLALPDAVGQSSWTAPIVPLVDKPLAFVITGASGREQLTLVDETGESKPLAAPLYARNSLRRLALVPIEPGRHHVRWSDQEGDLETEKGDLLLAWSDASSTLTSVEIVRGGRVYDAWKGRPKIVPGPELREIRVDGKALVKFGDRADVLAGTKFTRRAVAPLAHVFGAQAYEAGEVVSARTKTRELQATRVKQTARIAIVVRPL